MKVSILRRLFAAYGADPMDLVFFLKDADSEMGNGTGREEIRKDIGTFMRFRSSRNSICIAELFKM